MARWTPQKRDVLDSIADEFLHNYSKGRTLIAVDGWADTARFADEFAERLGRGGHAVFRASIADFQRPRALRHDQYVDGYDYDLFRRVLVDPFKLGGSTGFVTAAFDAARDVPMETDWKTGPQDATVVVDGQFLNRPALHGLWNYTIWLNGQEPEPYWTEAKPRDRASVIVDNVDVDHPRRVFADSC